MVKPFSYLMATMTYLTPMVVLTWGDQVVQPIDKEGDKDWRQRRKNSLITRWTNRDSLDYAALSEIGRGWMWYTPGKRRRWCAHCANCNRLFSSERNRLGWKGCRSVGITHPRVSCKQCHTQHLLQARTQTKQWERNEVLEHFSNETLSWKCCCQEHSLPTYHSGVWHYLRPLEIALSTVENTGPGVLR